MPSFYLLLGTAAVQMFTTHQKHMWVFQLDHPPSFSFPEPYPEKGGCFPDTTKLCTRVRILQPYRCCMHSLKSLVGCFLRCLAIINVTISVVNTTTLKYRL